MAVFAAFNDGLHRDGGGGAEFKQFLVYEPVAALDAVHSVGVEVQRHGEVFELLIQQLHPRIVPFSLVEYQEPLTVQRFKMRLYSGGFIALVAGIRIDGEGYSRPGPLLRDGWLEHLLEDRILE